MAIKKEVPEFATLINPPKIFVTKAPVPPPPILIVRPVDPVPLLLPIFMFPFLAARVPIFILPVVCDAPRFISNDPPESNVVTPVPNKLKLPPLKVNIPLFDVEPQFNAVLVDKLVVAKFISPVVNCVPIFMSLLATLD